MLVEVDLGIPAAQSTPEWLDTVTVDDMRTINTLEKACWHMSEIINSLRSRGIDISVSIEEEDG